MKVCKFGGTSMATAAAIEQAVGIVTADPDRAYVVVSAPGKRFAGDDKVTDLLIGAYNQIASGVRAEKALEVVFDRFRELVRELGIELDLTPYFDKIVCDLENGENRDYCMSRGEFLSAVIVAKRLGRTFVDAVEIIKFFDNGKFDSEYTNDVASRRLSRLEGAVIPGFYGQIQGRHVKTFSRGGSDISGAIVARAVKASVYENWTDVNGFLACDPRIVNDPKEISILTYRELRELSYMGASVLHPDAIFPTRGQDIPINIRNTFDPQNPGTMIVPTKSLTHPVRTVTGIVGKKNFLSIHVEKSMMNNELGFIRRALTVMEHYGVNVEHIPSGIDTLSLIIEEGQMSDEVARVIVSELKSALATDHIHIERGLAMIATVGHGMALRLDTPARLFQALARAGVDIVMIDQGSSGLNVIVGVREEQFELAINALYNELMQDEAPPSPKQ